MYNLQVRYMSGQNRVLTAEANPNLDKLALVPPTAPAIWRKLRFQNYGIQTASEIQNMLETPRRENRIGVSILDLDRIEGTMPFSKPDMYRMALMRYLKPRVYVRLCTSRNSISSK